MKKKIIQIIAFAMLLIFMCGCSKESAIMNSFSADSDIGIKTSSDSALTFANGFASDIGVVSIDSVNSPDSDMLYSEAALLVDITDGTVLFQKNAHKKEYPASTTKVLTTLLALKYADTDSSRKIGDEVYITEDNVVVCDFREGDVIPFDIVVHGAMLKSGNDAAAALALFVSDSLDEFADLMNKEARNLGATESHFVNPHGLYNDNHYSTAYDLYLIFNEAIKYDEFVKIISTKSFTGSFNRTTMYGEYIINCEYRNTNQYVNGERQAPEGIKVIGGKAGYTEVAKRSYVMLSEADGHQYISIVMRSETIAEMYSDLDYLLGLIPVHDEH